MSRLHPLKARTEALTALTGQFRGSQGDDPNIAAACEHVRNAHALVKALERLEVSLEPVRLEFAFPEAGDTSFLSALVSDAGLSEHPKSNTLETGGHAGTPTQGGTHSDLRALPGQKPPVPCFTPDPSRFFGGSKQPGDSPHGDLPASSKTKFVLLLPSPTGKGYAGRLFDACQCSLDEAEKLLVE